MRTDLKVPYAEDFAKYHMKGSTENRMSDAELRKKKKLQSRLSLTGSVLGLAGLGTLAGAGIVRRKPKLFGVKDVIRNDKFTGVPYRNRDRVAQKIKDKGYILGSTAGGVGGVGGINFAAIQREESRRRAPVAKSDYSIYSQNRYEPRVSRSSPDPERTRRRRQALTTPGLSLAGGALIAGSNQVGSAAEKLGSVKGPFQRFADKTRYLTEMHQANAQQELSRATADASVAQSAAEDAKNSAARARRNANARNRPSRSSERAVNEASEASRNLRASSLAAESAKADAVEDAKISQSRPKPKPVKDIKWARKAGKYGAIGLGTAALGGAVANEVQRHNGGKSYKGSWDKYKNQ